MITVEEIQILIDRIERGEILRELPVIEGYSSTKVRQLLNALNSHPDTKRYLEIGVHLGSTFIPAIFGNSVQATCIDNWSRFGNRRPHFEANLKEYLPKRKVNLIANDAFTVDLTSVLQPVDVYFFDGEHTFDDQYKAYTYYDQVFADRFVTLVDDWNWAEPRDATRKAFKDLGYNVIHEWQLEGDYNGTERAWWNGLGVFVVEKKTWTR